MDLKGLFFKGAVMWPTGGFGGTWETRRCSIWLSATWKLCRVTSDQTRSIAFKVLMSPGSDISILGTSGGNTVILGKLNGIFTFNTMEFAQKQVLPLPHSPDRITSLPGDVSTLGTVLPVRLEVPWNHCLEVGFPPDCWLDSNRKASHKIGGGGQQGQVTLPFPQSKYNP